jgi:hypothetical protein
VDARSSSLLSPTIRFILSGTKHFNFSILSFSISTQLYKTSPLLLSTFSDSPNGDMTTLMPTIGPRLNETPFLFSDF